MLGMSTIFKLTLNLNYKSSNYPSSTVYCVSIGFFVNFEEIMK